MKNILIINFDIIMARCLNLYKSYIPNDDATCNTNDIWNFLNERLEIENYISYDAKILQALVNLLKRSNGPIQELRFVSDVVPLITEPAIIKYIGCDCGINHSVKSLEEIEHFNKYNLTNWMSYLTFNELIEEFHWIKSPQSEVPTNTQFSELGRLDEILLFAGDYDTIYFVQSPHLIPYKYLHLYDLILSIFKEG